MPHPTVYVPKESASETRMGPWLTETFERFAEAWQVWVLQGCIMFGAIGLPLLIALGFFVPAYFEAFKELENQRQPSGTAVFDLLATYIYFVPLLVIVPPIWALLETGMLRTADKQLRGEPIRVADMFDTGGRYFHVLGYLLLSSAVIAGVNIVCCFTLGFAGMVVTGLLFFAHPLIVQGRLGIVEAMEVSYRTTKSHWVYYAVWVFLIQLLAQIGSVACYVGMAASIPLFPLATMIAYHDVFRTSAHIDPAIERTFE